MRRANESEAAGGAAVEQSSLVLRFRPGSGGRTFCDAQWRYRTEPNMTWRFKRRTLGLAWMEADGAGGWRKRKGRCPAGWLDERAANVAAVAAMGEHFHEISEKMERERELVEHKVTVREIAHEWIDWLEQVKGAKPSTVKDYRFLLRDPGEPYRRGAGVSKGRIMSTLGDLPAAEVTTADVTRFLRSLDAAGLTARNVNKHRQVLAAMFSYASRSDTHGLPSNPASRSDKRREMPPAALDYYEVEEVEALARCCERGEHRNRVFVDPEERAARALEDHRDAEAFRLLFYTGIRLGEALTLRWADVDLTDRLLLVRRNLSAGQETLPKGRQHRYVPLSSPAAGVLARLADREEFMGDDDYVLCNRWGRRLDVSALRRRYKRVCAAAGLRPVRLHGLRHAAGSLLARTSDAVFVRDFLGHSKLATTDRYLSAKLRPEQLARLDQAFASTLQPEPATAGE